MQINSYIEKIVNNGKPEDMEELSEILEDLMYIVKDYDEDCYEKYKMKLYGMAYNYKFTKEMAEEIVENMKPRAEIWDYETTNSVKNQYGLNNINQEDFYLVINSLGNDYADVISIEEVDTYVKMAKAWIEDKDAKEDKTWIYFTKIPK